MRSRLSLFQCLVVACLGLLALSGSAVAVQQITGNNVRDGSLTSADVKNGSLKAIDLRTKPRANDTTIRTAGVAQSDFPAGEYSLRSAAECMPGETAIGGGVEAPSGQGYDASAVTESIPATADGTAAGEHQEATRWQGRVQFSTTQDLAPGFIRVWVVCQRTS